MVSSVLQPEKIIGKQKPTKEQALSFVSGGSSLGSSVLSGAKNKIVNFDRAKVSAKPNNLQALISNLSTGVFNTTNTIQNIFGNKETKEKKSSKFFGGFFDKFKEALAFITFFGAKKNLDKIKDSLENLKITFSETFDVAKILRKIIKKIFDQLSGLSGDGGGGKGLWGLIAAAIASIIRKLFRGVVKTFSDIFERMSKNENTMRNIIDKIAPPPTPGPSAPSIGTAATTVGGIATGSGLASLPAAGTATKALPAAGSATKALPAAKGVGNIFSKMPKKGKFGLIAAGLGLATLGGTSMMNKSGLSQPGDEDVQPGNTAPEVPGNVLDRFNSILDRFDKILDGLKGKPEKSSGASSGSGSGSSSKPASPSAPPGGGDVTPTGQITGTQAEKETKMFSYLKGQVGENAATGILANAMRESGYRTNAPEGGHFGMFQLNKTREAAYKKWAKSKGLDPMDNGTQLQYSLGVEAKQLGIIDELKSADTPQKAASIWYNKFERAHYSKPIQGSAYRPDNPDEKKNSKYAEQILQRQKGTAAAQVPQAPTKPGQQAPQAPSSSKGPQPTQVISFPQPPAQVQPASSGGGGKISASPSPQQNGPTAPFYPSSNYDNFLTLYSRMVYNIVDG